MRSLAVLLTMLVATPPLGLACIIAAAFGVEDRLGGVYDRVPRIWCQLLLRAAGVRLVVHGAERIRRDTAQVYVANHVSWFDIFALASVVPRAKFIAKKELSRIPLFGQATSAMGTIFIDRNNRKAAFAQYEEAAARMHKGASVVVCPEGTRGRSYQLRPFKKGPFVLAIAAHAPVVPSVVYGAREVQPKGSFWIRSGVIELHFLEPIVTEGLSYEDRDRVSEECAEAMSRCLHEAHGVPTAVAPKEADLARDREVVSP